LMELMARMSLLGSRSGVPEQGRREEDCGFLQSGHESDHG
jgi:hypothetical protein